MAKTKKTARIEFRLTTQSKATIREKAKNAGMTLSAYIEYLLINIAA